MKTCQIQQVMERERQKKAPAKRVDIVTLKMVRESSIFYSQRNVKSPEDAYDLVQKFLEDVDREHFLVVCLDTKNQPTAICTSHVGSLNSSIVHPREVFKTAVLSNAASVIVAHNHPSVCLASRKCIIRQQFYAEDLAVFYWLIRA